LRGAHGRLFKIYCGRREGGFLQKETKGTKGEKRRRGEFFTEGRKARKGREGGRRQRGRGRVLKMGGGIV
jgi:hypothetical protein